MVISELVWSADRIAHIARRRVEPEVQDVCFGPSLVLRAKTDGPNPVYLALGRTDAGRHLLCVIISLPDGRGYRVTAREMTAPEKQRYAGWKKV